MPLATYAQLFAAFSFVLGAAIGSFLNVCIYRMPRDLSVGDPARSFCPNCKYQIPWWNNLPLLSWLLLRGRCANCAQPIAFRYFGVELLTGLLFLGVWWRVGIDHWVLAFPYWILVSLLVVATFIDFEFFIIPDEITIGGAVAGVLLSLAIPTLHGEDANLLGGAWGLAGAALGYGLLWAVVELGKLAFGRRKLAYAPPAAMRWVRRGEEADLRIAEEEMLWSDFFARGNERLLMECEVLEVDGERHEKVSAVWTLDWLEVGERRWELREERRDLGRGERGRAAARGDGLGRREVSRGDRGVSRVEGGALHGGDGVDDRRADRHGGHPAAAAGVVGEDSVWAVSGARGAAVAVRGDGAGAVVHGDGVCGGAGVRRRGRHESWLHTCRARGRGGVAPRPRTRQDAAPGSAALPRSDQLRACLGFSMIFPPAAAAARDLGLMGKGELPESVCGMIAGELRDMGAWLAAGRLSPEHFRAALLALESAKVRRHGLALRAEVLANGRTRFELRTAADDRVCATLDYDSGSRELSIHRLGG